MPSRINPKTAIGATARFTTAAVIIIAARPITQVSAGRLMILLMIELALSTLDAATGFFFFFFFLGFGASSTTTSMSGIGGETRSMSGIGGGGGWVLSSNCSS